MRRQIYDVCCFGRCDRPNVLVLGRAVGLERLCKGGTPGGEKLVSVGAVECRAHEGILLLVR